MTEDRVQIVVRTTSDKREQIKELAENKNTSMNQFIIDAIFKINSDSTNDSGNDSTDSDNDSTIVNILKRQLDKKDEQIENLQNIVDQQQQLTLQSNQHIGHLQIKLAKETQVEDSKEKPNNKKQKGKNGFFNRLFNF